MKNTNKGGALVDYDSEIQALVSRTAAKGIQLCKRAGVVGEKHQQPKQTTAALREIQKLKFQLLQSPHPH